MASFLALFCIAMCISSSLAWQSPWEKLTTNANPVLNIGAHEAVAVMWKIYVFGGLTENRTLDWPEAWTSMPNDLRVFDTITNQWSVPTTTGPVPPGRAWFAMSAVGSTLYVYGGQGFDPVNPFGDFYSFDTLTNTWTNLTKEGGSETYPVPAQGPALVQRQGKLYLFGGYGSNDLWEYTPSNNSWRVMATTNGIKPPVRSLPELKVWGNSLMLFGGEAWDDSIGYLAYKQDMWEYDFGNSSWHERVPVQALARRRLHYASIIVGNQWHFHGGDYGSCSHLDLLVPTTMLYDLRDDEWRDGYLPFYAEGPVVKRAKFTQVGFKVYMTGGYGGIKCSNSEQEYNNDVWTYDPFNIFVPLSIGFDN
ncbi:Epithiospecifier protein [Balamuthia mandrillaris]